MIPSKNVEGYPHDAGIALRCQYLKFVPTLSTLYPPTVPKSTLFPSAMSSFGQTLRDKAGHGISRSKSQKESPEACLADTVLPSLPSTSSTPAVVANLGSQPMSSFNVSGNIFRKLSYPMGNKRLNQVVASDFSCAECSHYLPC